MDAPAPRTRCALGHCPNLSLASLASLCAWNALPSRVRVRICLAFSSSSFRTRHSEPHPHVCPQSLLEGRAASWPTRHAPQSRYRHLSQPQQLSFRPRSPRQALSALKASTCLPLKSQHQDGPVPSRHLRSVSEGLSDLLWVLCHTCRVTFHVFPCHHLLAQASQSPA